MNDFDFDAAENEFADVELPTLELGPAERQIVQQVKDGFELLEEGLRRTLEHVEACRDTDFEAVMRDPAKAESLCEFSQVLAHMPQGVAIIALAAMTARAQFSLNDSDDLADAS